MSKEDLSENEIKVNSFIDKEFVKPKQFNALVVMLTENSSTVKVTPLIDVSEDLKGKVIKKSIELATSSGAFKDTLGVR